MSAYRGGRNAQGRRHSKSRSRRRRRVNQHSSLRCLLCPMPMFAIRSCSSLGNRPHSSLGNRRSNRQCGPLRLSHNDVMHGRRNLYTGYRRLPALMAMDRCRTKRRSPEDSTSLSRSPVDMSGHSSALSLNLSLGPMGSSNLTDISHRRSRLKSDRGGRVQASPRRFARRSRVRLFW
ncbi:hypothetical protein DSM100238_1343 [Bifidobacterium apri]|uniref:Uncharacterized protein n=1 Tax=Bifidobacterium apri TaxID=1769423 RepID=A0A6A2VH22_9BIFI|nr:hypothetical protein DSM100238_1343 [Bifidobacterium apri]